MIFISSMPFSIAIAFSFASMSAPIKHLIGGCAGTSFGCCHDNITPCLNEGCSDCLVASHLIGGCAGTSFGCCPDNITPCLNEGCSVCLQHIFNSSNYSIY